MATYAKGTTVDPGQSKAEIESTVSRFGATHFMAGWSAAEAIVAFEAQGRHVRFVLPLPGPDERRFTHYRRGDPHTGVDYKRTDDAARKLWEQAVREQWRALALLVKAKLAAVQAGIVTFEEEFLAHILMPNGHTVWEETRRSIAEAYETNEMPALMPG